MNKVQILTLSKDHWEEYKSLRLEALKTEPAAFASSFEESKSRNEEEWREFLSDKLLFAQCNGQLVGLVGYYFFPHKKLSHIANIVAMYVKKDFRGRGIGKLLFKNILEKIATEKQVKKMSLDVNPLQKEALALYSSFGFEQKGVLEKHLKVDGHYHDLIVLEKVL